MSDSLTPQAQLAAGTGLVTLAWYAMPDAIRSRGVRTALKTALLAASVAGIAAVLPKDEARWLPEQTQELSPGLIAAAAGGIAAGTALTVWGEKAVFAFGERRRARGVRFAHALPALGLAALGAASAYSSPLS